MLLLFNNGNSCFKNSMDRVLHTINETKAKIAIISQANMKDDEEHHTLRRLKFPNFKFEDKFFTGSNMARLSLIVHEDIEYVREEDLENDVNCVKKLLNA